MIAHRTRVDALPCNGLKLSERSLNAHLALRIVRSTCRQRKPIDRLEVGRYWQTTRDGRRMLPGAMLSEHRNSLHNGYPEPPRGHSSAGRAPALQAGGHRFDSRLAHHLDEGRTGQSLRGLGLRRSWAEGRVILAGRGAASHSQLDRWWATGDHCACRMRASRDDGRAFRRHRCEHMFPC